jgi:hypothetical protein
VVATTSPVNAAAAAAESAPGNPPTTDLDKRLRAQGYKVETRGDEIFYCRNEAIIGTRFERKVCATSEQLASMQQKGADATSKMQKGMNTLKGS